MSSSVFSEQKKQTELAIEHALKNVERIENALLSKRGTSSREKIMAHIVVSVAVSLFSIAVLAALSDQALGSLGEYSFLILLAAAVSVIGFVICQTYKIVVNRDYYAIVFEGLELVEKARKHLQSYKSGLEKKNDTWLASEDAEWNVKLKKGWDFQKALQTAEKNILEVEKKQQRHVETWSGITYAIAAVSVAATEVFLLEGPICSMLYENFGPEDWITPVYVFCAVLAAIGGPILTTYYLMTCKGHKFSIASLSWILAGGAVGMLGMAVIAFVVGATFVMVLTVLKIVWEIIKVVMIIAGAILFLFAIAGGFRRRQ